MTAALEAKAQNERRLGLLIMENKGGAALAAGVTHLRNAIEAWEEANLPTRKAEVLLDLGRLNDKREHHSEAADVYVEALRIFESSDAKKEASDAACGAGKAFLHADDVKQAVKYLKRALETSEDINDHLRIAANHLDLAPALTANEEPELAIMHAEKAMQIFSDFKKGIMVAKCLEEIGAASFKHGDFEKAEQFYEDSAEKSLELARFVEASETLSRYAHSEAQRGNNTKALELLERCYNIHKKANDKEMMAQTLRLLGMIHLRQGSVDDTFECYEKALDFSNIIEDQASIARTQYLIGSAYVSFEQTDKALPALMAGLEAAELAENFKLQERILAAVAKIHRESGDHEKALESMHNWVAILKELGERQEQLRVLGTIAEIHNARGASNEAEAHLRRLISVCTQDSDKAELLYAQHGLAVLLAKRGEHMEAVPHFQIAIQGYTEENHSPRTPEEAKHLSKLHYQFGNSLLQVETMADKALEQFQRSVDLYAFFEDDQSKARVLVGLGNAHNQLGHAVEAKQFLDEAAKLCESQGDMRATMIIRRATDGL